MTRPRTPLRRPAPVTLAEVLEALRLLQACDGQPVLLEHLDAQLQLARRIGPAWRTKAGGWLRLAERLGLIERVAERRVRRPLPCGGEQTVRLAGGWQVVV